MMHFAVCVAFGMVGIIAAFPSSARANFLTNGGFEEPDVPSAFVRLSGSQLPGWTIPNGSVDLINNYWPAFEGNQSLDLAGSTNNGGVLEQSFATTPGVIYLLTFQYGNNIDVSSASANVLVFSDVSSPLLDEDISHSGSSRSNMNYTSFSASFTADAAMTTLRFTSTSSTSNNGIALDNVAVTQIIPEPSALFLFSLGCFCMTAYQLCFGRRADIAAI